MEAFLKNIPIDMDALKDPIIQLEGETGEQLCVADFDSKNMQLCIRNYKETENQSTKAKLTITMAIMHGVIEEVLKCVESGVAMTNLVNYTLAVADCAECTEECETPKRSLWLCLKNLKKQKTLGGKEASKF